MERGGESLRAARSRDGLHKVYSETPYHLNGICLAVEAARIDWLDAQNAGGIQTTGFVISVRKCKEKKRASKRARGGERDGRIETRLDRREKHASWRILGGTQGGCHKLNGRALTVGVDMLLPLLCYLNYFVSVLDVAVVPSLVGTWCCAICIPGDRGVIAGPLWPMIGGSRDGIQIAAACTDNYIKPQVY